MADQRESSQRTRWVADDYLAGDAAGGFEPVALLAAPTPIKTADIFEAKAQQRDDVVQAEVIRETGIFCNCLETGCVAECPQHLVELDKNGDCPECGKSLGRVHYTRVHLTRCRRRRAPIRRIA